jgi:hypothetical protein
MDKSRHHWGKLVAESLAGAWRPAPPPFTPSEGTVRELACLLRQTGAAGVAWWRLQTAGTLGATALRPFSEAFGQQAFDAHRHHGQLLEVIAALNAGGCEPILVKGWSVARLYALPGIRPCGDMDLCVRPDQLVPAAAVLSQLGPGAADVDLHAGLADLPGRSWSDLWRRSRLVPLGAADVRILGAEDQLRHLCLHLVRHGAWRPLWLCDVAATLEALPPDFDWDYCLRRPGWLGDWITCTVGLATGLLGARPAVGNVPGQRDAATRVTSAVLDLWSKGAFSTDVIYLPWQFRRRTWRGLNAAISTRWPNPIRAAYKLHLSPYHRLPTRAVQAAAFGQRAAQYLVDRLRITAPVNVGREFTVHPVRVR